jgi:hypothetical protein
MTSPCVMAAMIRSIPLGHQGQRSMASAWVHVETSSPWASCVRRSRDTAPRAGERSRRSHWSRRCAGTWVVAWSAKPGMLAPRGPVSMGVSPSAPTPAPMRRTCWPTRSPPARRCGTEAAMVWASSGASSPSGSSPVATAMARPASRDPRGRRVCMTRRLIVWRTSAMSVSVGGSPVSKRGARPGRHQPESPPQERHHANGG